MPAADPHPFFLAPSHGFVRVAVATPRVALARPLENAARSIALAREAAAQGARIVLFPELGLTGYSLDELFFQRTLLDEAEAAVAALTQASRDLPGLIVAGAPLRRDGRLYNCAVAIHRGRVLGAVPKSFLPAYREFYEERYFASGAGRTGTIRLNGADIPFGPDQIFRATDAADIIIGIEICEDLWTPEPPSGRAALAGATILLNLSASNITVGKARHRHTLCQAQSARTVSAYLYSAAGPGESTTDLAWDGHAAIYENGAILAEGARFSDDPRLLLADIDAEALAAERRKLNTWGDAADLAKPCYREACFALEASAAHTDLLRPLSRFPFVPDDAARRDEDCYEAYNIQVRGLITRLEATGMKRLVIGISGGLDSTHALVVCARAMDRLGLPRANILAYTLPGFATSARTLKSAWDLMKAFGVTAGEIDMGPVSAQTLKDIGHPAADGAALYDVTYENVQAGARTATLFRLANKHDGLVVGTGDLSELALGWCTYGVGDHMSHYGVNAGVPKTMIQHLIRWVAATGEFGQDASAALIRVLETEISPELVPGSGEVPAQKTEDMIGPYALQDFTLYQAVRHGFAPAKIAFLAHHAWGDALKGQWPEGIADDAKRAYTLPEIAKWLRVFLWRFYQTSQFKRSALPNGPKVIAGASLSPRGDWRAPSDSSAQIWLDALKRGLPPEAG
jgi:NAD+ synthase (glutamine-hydrolysing)